MANKLLFYVEHYSMAGSGAENDAVILCTALARHGYEVHIACEDGSEEDGVILHQSLAEIERHRARIKPDVTIDWGFFHEADLYRIGGGPHRCFLEYYAQSFPPWLRPVKRLGFNTAKHRRARKREDRLLQRPDSLFLAISNFVAEQAIRSGAAPSAVRVLHNGVDNAKFDTADNRPFRQKIREKHGLAENDIVCLFAAHNLQLKNFALLHALFSELAHSQPQVKLLVVGKRKPSCSLSNVIYAGSTDKMEMYYAAADILLHPSFYDSFGNVILEAMSASLPVIISNCCGAGDIIINGQNGYILPVAGCRNSFGAWLQLLTHLSRDAAQRQCIGSQARRTAMANNKQNYIQQFSNEIEHAAERNNARNIKLL